MTVVIGGADHRVPVHPDHRRGPGRPPVAAGTLIRLGIVPFVIFIIAITAETQPPALRPGRGRAGAGRRVQHRVLVDPLRPVLPGRVHEHHHHVGHHRDPVLRGPRRAHPAHRPSCTGCGPILWFLGKTIVFLFVFVWLRAALPRLRYDQLMDLGWKVLIPLSLGWLLIVAGFVVDGWWGVGMVVAVVAAAVAAHPGVRHRLRAGGDPGHRAPGRRVRLWTRARERSRGPASRRAPPRGGALMATARPASADDQNFLGGFKVTLEQLRRPPVTRQYPEEKRPKQPRQHGRHVLNRYEDGMEKCIGCELCAGVCPADCIYVRGLPTTPRTDPVSPGRALRLRLRDQLPAVHPLRPVRRGVSHRGHHRVQALRVLLHQPGRRHLHQGGAAGRRRRPAPAAALGGLARGRRPAHLGLDAGHLTVGSGRLSRARCSGRASWATGSGPPRVGQSERTATTPRTGSRQLRETLERHLDAVDLPGRPAGAAGGHRPDAGEGRAVRPRGRQEAPDRADAEYAAAVRAGNPSGTGPAADGAGGRRPRPDET